MHPVPVVHLRTIGEERSLFAFYLLNDGSFAECLGIADAKIVVAAQKNRFEDRLGQKLESARFSRVIEHVANELATRRPEYASGLWPEVLAGFDPPESRQNYVRIQSVLANLRLRERAELGRAFESTTAKLGEAHRGLSTGPCASIRSRSGYTFSVHRKG